MTHYLFWGSGGSGRIEQPVVAENGEAVAWTDMDAIHVWNPSVGLESRIESPGTDSVWLLDHGGTVLWRQRNTGRMLIRRLEEPGTSVLKRLSPNAVPLGISPRGRYLVMNDLAGAGVWDTVIGERVVALPVLGNVNARFLDEEHAVVAEGQRLLIVDAREGTYRVVVSAKRAILRIDVSTYGDILAAGKDGETALVNPGSGASRVFPGEEWAYDAQFSPDAKAVVTAEAGTIVRIRPDDLQRDPNALLEELGRRSNVTIAPTGQLTATPPPR
jgi:hypothetical protein